MLAGLALVASLFNPFTLQTLPDEVSYPPIICETNPCVIQFSPGGIIDLFEAEGRELAAENIKVIIDGPCFSACTRLVDIDRANVCVTHRALLGYHQWSFGDQHGDMKFDTPGLMAYIVKHGGQPAPDSGRLLTLNFSEAKQFYRACP